jgi:hypothetical protein
MATMFEFPALHRRGKLCSWQLVRWNCFYSLRLEKSGFVCLMQGNHVACNLTSFSRRNHLLRTLSRWPQRTGRFDWSRMQIVRQRPDTEQPYRDGDAHLWPPVSGRARRFPIPSPPTPRSRNKGSCLGFSYSCSRSRESSVQSNISHVMS